MQCFYIEYEHELMHRQTEAIEDEMESDLTDHHCSSLQVLFQADSHYSNPFIPYHDLTLCPYTLSKPAFNTAKAISSRLSWSRCRKFLEMSNICKCDYTY
jgi:hypothetical protein